MEFGTKLKELRAEKGVSQAKLAADIHISRSAVAKWENGFSISRYCAKKGESYIRRFLLVEAFLITVLEIYKQINFSFHVDGGPSENFV